MRKRGFIGCVLFLCLLLAWGRESSEAEATGALIKISSNQSTAKKGDTVYVVITVKSSDAISGFTGYFTYDSRVLKFETGGSVVTGNDDYFKIEDTDRSSSDTSITYSVKFTARKPGSCTITLRTPYEVTAEEDSSSMSVSYNELAIEITKKNGKSVATATPEAESTASPEGTALPDGSAPPDGTMLPEGSMPSEESALPEATRSADDVAGSNKLRSLSVEGAELAPEFSADINKYSAIVTTDQKKLSITYEAEDSLATVKIKGNSGLKKGKNIIKIVVKSTAGEKNVYTLSVTIQRTKDSAGGAGSITVTQKNGVTYVKGTLTIELMEAASEDIPSGFYKTQIEIDGQSISAYALESNADASFVLLYGKGDEEGFYLYDQSENLLMPYEKVKAWYRSMEGQAVLSESDEEKTIKSLQYVIGILAALCGLLVLALAAARFHLGREKRYVTLLEEAALSADELQLDVEEQGELKKGEKEDNLSEDGGKEE